ncbi:MAG: hypothetical protein IJ284_01435 [Clostridia bacterium]|nr:hypothetical protein [Clostridia bacterium]
MKRKLKAKLIVFLLAILSLFVFAGCSMGESLEEILETRNLNPQVTYYTNGGQFENKNRKKDIYYSVGSKALNIGVVTPVSGSIEITRANFEFVGWYHVAEVIDEESGLCELGEAVDFSVPLEEGDHWIVAAKWRALAGLKVVMACEDGKTISGTAAGKNGGAVSYKNGDTLGEIEYDSKDEIVSSATTPEKVFFKVKNKAYTFVGYYTDAKCTTPVTWPIKRGVEQQTIYAKYVAGDWTLVKDSQDVYDMFEALRNGANKRYWLCNDIDSANSALDFSVAKFAGEINGNGYTIKNLTVNKTVSATEPAVALFGAIEETAVLKDITFENVNFNVTMKLTTFQASVYFAFLSKAEGATVSNVNLSGKMTVDGVKGAVVENINAGDAADYTKCLFGGYNTDSEYVTASEGKEFVVAGTAEDIVDFQIVKAND